MVALLLIVAPAASAETQRASAGETSATYTDFRDGTDTTLWLTIERAGEIAFDRSVARSHCDGGYCRFGGFRSRSLAVADLDRDGEPEVALTVFTGGAHCCFIAQVYRRTANGGYRPVERQFGNQPVSFRDLDRDGRPELVTADDRFAYRFTFFARSFAPLQVWGYSSGRFVERTRRHRSKLRAEAGWLWNFYRGWRANRDEDVRGVFAAWAADSCRLGKRRLMRRELRRGVRRGFFAAAPGFDVWPGGSRYERALLRFLRRTGYCR